MPIRRFSLLVALALVIAACGSNPDALPLSYTLESGDSFQYEVELDQNIDLTSSGDTASLGEGEELPEEMSIGITGTSVLTHAVADGPEPGTYSITITGDFSDLEFSGTMDGEPVESAEIPDLAEMQPIDVTVVVDEQGNIIPEDNPGLGEDLLGDLGGLDMLNQFSQGASPGQFVGPPLPDGEVTVGDSWTETVELPGMPGGDPITTQVDSEIVSTDTVDGNDVFVIETTSTTSAVEFDLAELLIGFMSAFVPEGTTDEEQAEIDAMVDQLRLAFSVDETVGDLTTWFDYEAGLARQAEFANATHMVMDMNIPDQTSGELVEFALDMNIDQEISYRLVDDGSGDGS